MYERMRKEILLGLLDLVDEDTSSTVMAVVDKVSAKYDISLKETGLSIYQPGPPEMFRDYMACKKLEGLSAETLHNYSLVVGRFLWTIGKHPKDITANDIRIYLWKYQEERKISNRTLDKYREYIGRFFAWAFEEGYIEDNPSKTVKAIRHEKPPRKTLKRAELDQLRTGCNDIRDKAIIEFLYSTGCRVSELAIVKLSDIDWELQQVKLFGKGRKHRVSFLTDQAIDLLREYLEVRVSDTDYLFVKERKPHGPLRKDGLEKIVRLI